MNRLCRIRRQESRGDGVRRIAEAITRHDESLPVMANDELADADSNGTLDAFEQAETWTDREYIYGPGDVDEFVCQIDRDGRVLYMLQDANLNVVALLDNANGSPVVLEQYTWDPYGQVLARDVLDADANPPPIRPASPPPDARPTPARPPFVPPSNPLRRRSPAAPAPPAADAHRPPKPPKLTHAPAHGARLE